MLCVKMIYAERLAELPAPVRHLYYILTSLRPISYLAWLREGEPNPFVCH